MVLWGGRLSAGGSGEIRKLKVPSSHAALIIP